MLSGRLGNGFAIDASDVLWCVIAPATLFFDCLLDPVRVLRRITGGYGADANYKLLDLSDVWTLDTRTQNPQFFWVRLQFFLDSCLNTIGCCDSGFGQFNPRLWRNDLAPFAGTRAH